MNTALIFLSKHIMAESQITADKESETGIWNETASFSVLSAR